ncbi:MAG: hypothetical protein JWR63_3097, partial [Conexibacter sp.]|nr:hypothetical protein [Conexibacter sp.]
MPARSIPFIVAIALIALPAALALAAPAGAGADDLSVTRQGTELVARLTGAAATAAAPYVGKELTISCESGVAPGLLFGGGDRVGQTGSSAMLRRDPDGSLVLRTYFSDRVYDVCEVDRPLVRRKVGQQGPFAIYAGDRGPAIGRAALTPAGTVWLDELAHAKAMHDASVTAAA